MFNARSRTYTSLARHPHSFRNRSNQSRLIGPYLLAGCFMDSCHSGATDGTWCKVLSERRQDIGSTMPAKRNNQAFNDLSLSGILVEVVLQTCYNSATSRLTWQSRYSVPGAISLQPGLTSCRISWLTNAPPNSESNEVTARFTEAEAVPRLLSKILHTDLSADPLVNTQNHGAHSGISPDASHQWPGPASRRGP